MKRKSEMKLWFLVRKIRSCISVEHSNKVNLAKGRKRRKKAQTKTLAGEDTELKRSAQA